MKLLIGRYASLSTALEAGRSVGKTAGQAFGKGEQVAAINIGSAKAD